MPAWCHRRCVGILPGYPSDLANHLRRPRPRLWHCRACRALHRPRPVGDIQPIGISSGIALVYGSFMVISIYGLIDPRTSELRYVGQTSRRVKTRLTAHLKSASDKSKLHVAVWLRGVLLDGLCPDIEVFEAFEDDAEADEAEAFWIQYFSSIGCRLTNRCTGGRTRRGWHHSQETRDKWRRERRGPNAPRYGQPKSERELAAMSASAKETWKHKPHPMLGKRHSEETRAKIKANRKPAKPLTPEASEAKREKLRNAWKVPGRRERFTEKMSGPGNHNFGKRLPEHVLEAAWEASRAKKGIPHTPAHTENIRKALIARGQRIREERAKQAE